MVGGLIDGMNRPGRNFTVFEVVIALVVLMVGLALLLSQFSSNLSASAKMLNDMKRLHELTRQMAMDARAAGRTNGGWPGDMGGSFTNWAAQLVRAGM